MEEELGLNTLVAMTLAARGYSSIDLAQRFLDSNMEDDWGDASMLPGIVNVADSLESAVREGRRILIFGDYDVDGLTSTAILYRVLTELGANVDTMIPNRLDEGYGLSQTSVERISECKPEFVVTVDCGISACEEVACLRSQGIEVAVTDHHVPYANVPCDVPLCDPKTDPSCPDAILAGVGVVLKLVELLSKRFDQDDLWRSYTDLAALGTLADLMPLRGMNRALVRDGLMRMNTSLRPGLAALWATCSSSDKDINAVDLMFSIIPRLNAAGRMGDAQLALDLLLTEDIRASFELAAQLDALNNERRNLERELFELAEAQALCQPPDSKALVLSGTEWHEGVKGIVASRIANAFGVPTIIFSIEGNQARGSGRSVGSINLFDAVEKCSDYLIRFGGHSAAVGVTLEVSQLTLFQQHLEDIISLEPVERFHPPLMVDASIRLATCAIDEVKALEALEPYGQDNPEPLFVTENLFITRARSVGADNSHLAFQASDGLTELGAIYFNCSDIDHWLSVEHAVDVVFVPKIEMWNGRSSVKLFVKALIEKPEYMFSEKDACSLASPIVCDSRNSAGIADMGSVQKDTEVSWHTLASRDPERFAKTFLAHVISPHAQLHEAQQKALAALSRGENTLAIMATGRGKSLLFQIHAARAALAYGNASLLIFPLRALINDQAFHITSLFLRFGLKAIRLTGDIQGRQRLDAFEAFARGDADIVLTTPEFLELHATQLSSLRKISFVAIDEAHHIATSSSKHRISYTRLAKLMEHFPDATILGLTATSDDATTAEIHNALAIETVIIDPTVRLNLRLVDHRHIRERSRYVASFLTPDKKTIVYVRTRNEALQVARTLRKMLPSLGHQIMFYHAGLVPEDRLAVEASLRSGEACCVVATSAFGEGINIPDIRNVILYQLPFSTIEFNQMSGRCGRDGEPADIHLLFNKEDVVKNRLILAKTSPVREDLAIVWRVIKEMGYDSFELPDALPAKNEENGRRYEDMLKRCMALDRSFGLNSFGLAAAFGIFEELGLIVLEKREDRYLAVPVETDTRVELDSSALYREGLNERTSFEVFSEWVMNASSEELLNVLNRPMMPKDLGELRAV